MRSDPSADSFREQGCLPRVEALDASQRRFITIRK
jgi:hypothetical protein